MLDKSTGRSRGFGFVTFVNGDEIDKVLGSEEHEIDDRIVDVKRALPRGAAPPRKVTIYNLRAGAAREGAAESVPGRGRGRRKELSFFFVFFQLFFDDVLYTG